MKTFWNNVLISGTLQDKELGGSVVLQGIWNHQRLVWRWIRLLVGTLIRKYLVSKKYLTVGTRRIVCSLVPCLGPETRGWGWLC